MAGPATSLPSGQPRFWYENYSGSARKMKDIAAKAGADVLLSNHSNYDGTKTKLPALTKRKAGDRSPVRRWQREHRPIPDGRRRMRKGRSSLVAQLSSLPAVERVLLGPGPSVIPPRVMRAMAAPVLSHLDPDFVLLLDDVRARLARLFKAPDGSLTIATSGTGTSGMEAMVANLVGDGTRVLVVVTGYFGERLAEMCRRYGADVRAGGSGVGPRDRSAGRARRRSRQARPTSSRASTRKPPPAC